MRPTREKFAGVRCFSIVFDLFDPVKRIIHRFHGLCVAVGCLFQQAGVVVGKRTRAISKDNTGSFPTILLFRLDCLNLFISFFYAFSDPRAFQCNAFLQFPKYHYIFPCYENSSTYHHCPILKYIPRPSSLLH